MFSLRLNSPSHGLIPPHLPGLPPYTTAFNHFVLDLYLVLPSPACDLDLAGGPLRLRPSPRVGYLSPSHHSPRQYLWPFSHAAHCVVVQAITLTLVTTTYAPHSTNASTSDHLGTLDGVVLTHVTLDSWIPRVNSPSRSFFAAPASLHTVGASSRPLEFVTYSHSRPRSRITASHHGSQNPTTTTRC